MCISNSFNLKITFFDPQSLYLRSNSQSNSEANNISSNLIKIFLIRGCFLQLLAANFWIGRWNARKIHFYLYHWNQFSYYYGYTLCISFDLKLIIAFYYIKISSLTSKKRFLPDYGEVKRKDSYFSRLYMFMFMYISP